MKKIYFIINPISGSGKRTISKELIDRFFDKEEYDIIIKTSEYKGHSEILAQQSVNDNATIVIACGGDGTINEVASVLVNTCIPLGIIPLGSGNGLASNLKIPKVITKALQILKNNHKTAIDVGCINERYFFSNTGLGFDACVIKNYEQSQKHTLLYYIKSCIKSLVQYNQQQSSSYRINGLPEINNPFLIFISNSNEMGYKMSFTPNASLEDGMLDVFIVPKLSRVEILFFGFLTLIKKQHLMKGITTFKTDALLLSRKQNKPYTSQIDGEYRLITDYQISISVKPKSLQVIC